MNRMHALWQMKGEQVSTSLGDDGKRTKELLWEFLQWPSGADVIQPDEYFISNMESSTVSSMEFNTQQGTQML